MFRCFVSLFRGLVMLVCFGCHFGNRSKRIASSFFSRFLSISLNLTKEQIDRSMGQRAYLFVNGRKEYVKFSRINCFASLFGILCICHIDECGSQARERFTTPYR